jgi:FtsZ-interacting cell division protein ZipA
MLRQRGPHPDTRSQAATSTPNSSTMSTPDDPRRPLLGPAKDDDAASLTRRHAPSQPESYNSASQEEEPEMDLQNMSRKSQWIILAVASGACAAFNGVFAKL